jgi:hypothetical protein
VAVLAACGRSGPVRGRSAEGTAPASTKGGEPCASADIEAGLPPLGVFDAELTRLFTPARLPQDSYRVCVSATPIEILVASLRLREPAPSPGSWRDVPTEPLRAFGSTGPSDPFRLARAYGNLRPKVARGPIDRNGRVVASLTLISPYPDGTLSYLMSGTLVVVIRIPSLAP